MQSKFAVKAWRAWYSDGVLTWWYNSAQLPWSQLPPDQAQVIKLYYEQEWKPGHPYTRTLDGCDWYYMAPDGSIEGVKSVGWDDYRPRPCGVADELIKRGTAVPDAVFAEISELARREVKCP